MFEALSSKLNGVFDRLRRRGALSEADVSEALREVRVALLEADVALPVVKDLVSKVRERAVGAEVLKSVSPAQQVIKIVNDCLVDALGGGEGDKVKVTLRFRGREMAHQDLGIKVLERIRVELGETIKVEQMPRLENRQMIMVLAPK